MQVYRITREEYRDDLSGYGAKLYGGRWNEKGTAVLYTCENKALTVLELLVHTPKQFKPPKYVILTIEIPDVIVGQIKNYQEKDLPKGWSNPLATKHTQAWGMDKLLGENQLGFIIPSVILKSEKNIVLNPLHKDYKQVRIIDQENLLIDERLLK